ncbi:MAG: hypothetical protein NC092_12870 [Butyrivibrio sp.]|nr:hypothetical protein [Muribaculum sp.]MCM1553566.1 hypothetical protein [Butyrivibrio sp.]
MKQEELFDAIGMIHSETIERNLWYIKINNTKAMENNEKRYEVKLSAEKTKISGLVQMRKIAACIAIATVLLIGSSGIAYAMVPSFREFINAIIFPEYSTEEMVAIRDGHMTGAFDEQDVLLTFLDKFNKKEWGNEITVPYENGYIYEMYCEDADSLVAFVDSSRNDFVVAVCIKKLEYAETSGIWQVEGYQVLRQADAQDWKASLTVYSSDAFGEQSGVQGSAASDAFVTAAEEVLLYNVNNKDKAISIEQEDAEYLVSLFESYSFEQIAFEGFAQYVVKTENKKYLLDSQGHVVVDEDGIQGMFRLNRKDFEDITSMFNRYGIFVKDQAEQAVNDHAVFMGEFMISISENKQDITAKLDAAGLSYVERKADNEQKGKYDSYYAIGASLQVYFLEKILIPYTI